MRRGPVRRAVQGAVQHWLRGVEFVPVGRANVRLGRAVRETGSRRRWVNGWEV